MLQVLSIELCCRWLFIIEGCATAVYGVLLMVCLHA